MPIFTKKSYEIADFYVEIVWKCRFLRWNRTKMPIFTLELCENADF